MSDDGINQRTPADVGAERALLGGILLDSRAAEAATDEGLAAEDFYDETHGLIWKAIGYLAKRREPIDPVTVADVLQRGQKLETVGGPVYLSQMQALMPTAAHVASYARKLREHAQRRRVLYALDDAREDCLAWEDLADIQASVTAAFDAAHGGENEDSRHISEYSAGALAILEGQDRGRYISTGFKHLDVMLGGGFERGRLYLVAARPGAGKTAFGDEVLAHAALSESPTPAELFTLEMDGEEQSIRLWAQDSNVSPRKVQKGQATQEELNRIYGSAGILGEAPIWFADRPGASIRDIQRIVRRDHRKHGIGLLIVDYLQLMDDEGGDDSKANRVGEITKGLKNLARELGIAVVCLSQLNRKVEERGDKKPQMSDLRDSGAIEQDADGIILLWRPEQYSLSKPAGNEGKVALIIAKHRNGPTGLMWLQWEGPSFRMDDCDASEWPKGDAP